MAGVRWAGVKRQKWHGVLAALGVFALASFGMVALARRGDAPHDDRVAAAEVVPAPADLLCDLYVASPNASWGRLQRGVGGAAGILPTTLPAVLIALTGLDPRLATELDGTSPMYGAVAGDPADPGVALAMKLVDARRARALFAGGEGAPYTARDAGGITLLDPATEAKGRGAGVEIAIAIAPNGYLLAARRQADVERLGPYVTRTLPARTLPAESAVLDVPRAALKTLLEPKLEALWKDGKAFLLAEDERARAARGRAPDFADPAAIVAAVDAVLARRLAILGDLEGVRIGLDVGDEATVITATLKPREGEGPARAWIASMSVGDASEVLALPATSLLALSSREGEAERVDQAAKLEEAVASSLGPRLKEPSRLHEAFASIAKARGDSLAVALDLEGAASVLVRAPVRDGDAADAAVRGALDLARVEPFRDLLGVRGVSSGAEELPGLGKVSTMTITRAPREAKEGALDRARGEPARGAPRAPSPIGFAWTVERASGSLALGAGAEPVATLRTGVRPERKLGDEPSVTRFASALGGEAATIVVAQPLRLDPSRASAPAAPLGIAVGRRGGAAFVRLDVATELLRGATRWLAF